jgi:hypothetical protein
MTKPIRLRIEKLDPDATAALEALLAAVEDAWPPGLGRSGELSRADLITLRDQAAEATALRLHDRMRMVTLCERPPNNEDNTIY